ncbi:Proton pump-interactor 1 [Morella rubra]|uniref:Proton pump-interactor 1 n=1 Tax=Morella rubra TaxID=262757 RepID=A0A6A1VHG2_9ROSI|nr:Proton pump-interactor 1 [Morella rubra]
MYTRGRLLSSLTRLRYCGDLEYFVDFRRRELDLLQLTLESCVLQTKDTEGEQPHRTAPNKERWLSILAEEKRLLKETNANPQKTIISSRFPLNARTDAMWWFHYSEKSRSGWGTTGAFNQSAGEEKRLIREGNQLERLKEEAITGAMRFRHSLRSKQAIHDDVKERDIEKVLQRIEKDMKSFDEQLRVLRRRKANADQSIRQRKLHSEESSCYSQNLSLLKNARKLARNKNLAALEESSQKQVDIFMSQWNNSKAFRGEYAKRVLPSLDCRQLTEDGRTKNCDENPQSSFQKVPKTTYGQKQNGNLKWHMKNATDPRNFALMAKRMQQHIKYVYDLQIPLLGR